MAQGHGTAVGIGLGGVQPQLSHAGDRLGGKGLVELHHSHIGNRQPGFLHHLGHGIDGAQAHVIWLTARHCIALQDGDRGDAQLLRLGPGHQHHKGRRIAGLGGGRGGDPTVLFEAGLHAGQRLQVGIPANPLVLVKDDVISLRVHAGQRNDLVVKLSGILGGRCTAMALHRQFLHLPAGDAIALSHVLRREAHRDVLLLAHGQEL